MRCAAQWLFLELDAYFLIYCAYSVNQGVFRHVQVHPNAHFPFKVLSVLCPHFSSSQLSSASGSGAVGGNGWSRAVRTSELTGLYLVFGVTGEVVESLKKVILSENRPSAEGPRAFTRLDPVLQKEEPTGPVGSHLLVFIWKRNQHLQLLKSCLQSTSTAFTSAAANRCWVCGQQLWCSCPASRHSPRLAP